MKRVNMMQRRHFLSLAATAAGAAMLAPFFARRARAGGNEPARFVFFVEGNGYEPVTVTSALTRAALDPTLVGGPIGSARFWPKRYQHRTVIETQGDLSTAPSLQSLGSLADKTAVLLGLSSRITGGGHSALHGVLSSRRSNGKLPTGPTIDAVLAGAPRVAGAVFDAVRFGYASQQHHAGKNLDLGTCALGDGVPAPLVLQPQNAFDMLFSAQTNAAQFAREGSMLAFAREDVARALADDAVNGALAQSERTKLIRYQEAIASSEARRARLAQAQATLPTLPTRLATRSVEDIFDVLGAHSATLSVALQGGLSNVGVIGIGTGADFDTFYDASHTGRHTAHHESESSSAQRDYIHATGRLQLEVMLDFARGLDAVPAGTGTLLDHTVCVYIGDNGETHHAEADEFPVVLVGGGALGLVTQGRTLVYPGLSARETGEHRQVSNLWNTLGALAGLDLNDFGGESLRGGTRVVEGPLLELL